MIVKKSSPSWDKHAQLIQSWSEIAATICYRQLSPERQAEARDEFFKIVVQPQLSAQNPDAASRELDSELLSARAEFEQAVERGCAA